MDGVSVWVAVGVFAAVVGGQPTVQVAAAEDPYPTKAACEAFQDEAREKIPAVEQPGAKLVGMGLSCVEVTVERLAAPTKSRPFTPDEKSGKAKGSI